MPLPDLADLIGPHAEERRGLWGRVGGPVFAEGADDEEGEDAADRVRDEQRRAGLGEAAAGTEE
ncbi:hypothetical protein, partial [Streptomyces sp. NPDC048269]|uniref:hypothetical protein n=1 Tax=Streptomyces sp. NPDC048269 TaxID=3155753 RepID=UPI00343C3FE8